MVFSIVHWIQKVKSYEELKLPNLIQTTFCRYQFGSENFTIIFFIRIKILKGIWALFCRKKPNLEFKSL